MKKLGLSTSVLGTIAYSSVFRFPLTEEEILERLMGVSGVTSKQLQTVLSTPSDLKKVQGFWVLKGEESLINLRKKREYFSKFKQSELKTLLSRLKKIPTITSVYVTGSLAMNNIRSVADDIDILIVTKPHTLWLTRLIVVLWTSMIGKYRLHGSSGEWGWCFNLWLDQNHLEMPKDYRSIYNAYEVVQAKQVLGTENELRRANQWVSEYLNYPAMSESVKDYKTRSKGGAKNSNFNFFKIPIKIIVGFFDNLAYFLQRLYMQPKRSRERVGRGFAFFHPRDTKNIIFKAWLKKLEKLGVREEERAELSELFRNVKENTTKSI